MREHSGFAWSLQKLATVHAIQGKHVQAEALFKEALAIQVKVLGPEHSDVARLLNNYADPPKQPDVMPRRQR